MTYVDGFVIAVPKANKQAFVDHARMADPCFMEMGAVRILESTSRNSYAQEPAGHLGVKPRAAIGNARARRRRC